MSVISDIWGKGAEYNKENLAKKLFVQSLSPVWSKYHLENMVVSERYNQLWKKGSEEIFSLTLDLQSDVTEPSIVWESLACDIKKEERVLIITCHFDGSNFKVINLFAYDNLYKSIRYQYEVLDVETILKAIFLNFKSSRL